MLEAVADAARSAADSLLRQPVAWLWRCCVRRPHGGLQSVGPPLWLRPPRGGHGALGPMGALAAMRAGELLFPLLTMTLYGRSWGCLHAVLHLCSTALAAA